MTDADAEEDAAVRLRAAGGERHAFSLLMRETQQPVHRYIRRYVGDEGEALDLLQETYASAWLAIRRYDPARPFEAWVRRIALNKCRDWSRRRAVRRFFTSALSVEHPSARAVADTAPDPAARSEQREATAALEQALAELSPQLREALLLTTTEGLSQREAADLIGVTPKTIETRVYRARLRLNELMRSAGHAPT